MKETKNALVLAALMAAVALTACGKKESAPAPSPAPSTSSSSSTPPPPSSSSSTAPAPSSSDTSSASSTPAASPPSASASATPGSSASASSSSPSGAASAATPGATATASAGGEDTYNKTCMACHGAGVAGAPKFGDKADWGPRIAQGKQVLYTHAIQGFQGQKGVMPPKGGATTLSDDDVKAAVDYMVSKAS